jgi:hypothetical protein
MNQPNDTVSEDPATWPAHARDALKGIEARERELRDKLRSQRDAELRELGRVSFFHAIEKAGKSGKLDPQRWVRVQIMEGHLPAWGTIDDRIDQRFDPAWFRREHIFSRDKDSQLDDCFWFEPGDDVPFRISDVAVDAAILEHLLTGESEPVVVSAKSHAEARAKYESRVAEYQAMGGPPPLETTKKGEQGDRERGIEHGVPRPKMQSWRSELVKDVKRGPRPKNSA